MTAEANSLQSKRRLQDELSPTALDRPPLKAVRILLPVWGYRHTRRFLEACLPSVLAPGNLPAMARELPCEFVLMTTQDDSTDVLAHPLWKRLAETCRARTEYIDDLVFDRGHSTTITLAYERAIRATGGSLLDTCFVFLVADLLIADGGLASLLGRIKNGWSGVCTGHLQIVAEDVMPAVRGWAARDHGILSADPRQLLALALNSLHPDVAENIVSPLRRSREQTNRLFWRVDADTLIGRFYLLHMAAIRPEVANFEISSSCDYSFVPEMCPSNNVCVLTDSDEYLALELQPGGRGGGPSRAAEPQKLAASLSQWTTARHRENARSTVVFHAAAISSLTAIVEAEADAFIAEIDRHLVPRPQPHRHHRYWIAGMAARRALAGYAGAASPASLSTLLWRLRFAAFGRPPNVRPWHPRWPDFQRVVVTLRHHLHPGARLALVSNVPDAFRTWPAEFDCARTIISLDRLLDEAWQRDTLAEPFDAVVIVLLSGEQEHACRAIKRIAPAMKPGSTALVLAIANMHDDIEPLAPELALSPGWFARTPIWSVDARPVSVGPLRLGVQRALTAMARLARDHSPLYGIPAAVGFTFLALASYLCNKLALRAVPQLSKQGAYSSLLLVLHARNDPKSAACRQMGGNLEHPAGSDLRVGTASPKGDAARMIDRASLQMAQFRSIDLVRRFAS